MWWRAYDDSIHNKKLLKLSDAMHRAWYTLQCLTSQNGGTLPPAADVAAMLRVKPAKVAEWITVLVTADLYESVGGVFKPKNWDSRQFKSDCSTERVKRFRNKKANVSETADETKLKQDQRTETESETEQTQTRARAPDRFEDFWKAYPRRDGPNPRKPAEQKFRGLVKSGVDPETMIAAARQLSAAEAAKGNVGTRFIPQAMTWLNQQRWEDHSAIAGTAGEPELPIEDAVRFFAQTRKWSRWAGPEPGQIGCRAPAELLKKYGLGADGRKLEPAET